MITMISLDIICHHTDMQHNYNYIPYTVPEKAMAPHSSTPAWKIQGWRSLVGCRPWGREESDTTERLHFHFSLSCIGEEMATHSSVLAWGIPGMAEPGGLPSMGSHRVGHDWSDLTEAAAATLYISCSWPIYFATKSLYLLISLICFTCFVFC